MAARKRNTTRKHIHSEGTYPSEELKSLTLDDGTRVVTSADGDIRRPVCAGLDVHKEILMAAVCKTDPETLKAVFYVRRFQSTNSDIRNMAQWFQNQGVQDACMESTGKYCIPVYNILEQCGLKSVLTHPKYVKQAKGQKTDSRDAVHIASLFRMDLVVASFISPADIRDLRELPLPSEAHLYADIREEPFPEFHDCIQGAAGLRVLRSLRKICIRHHGIPDRDGSGLGQR